MDSAKGLADWSFAKNGGDWVAAGGTGTGNYAAVKAVGGTVVISAITMPKFSGAFAGTLAQGESIEGDITSVVTTGGGTGVLMCVKV